MLELASFQNTSRKVQSWDFLFSEPQYPPREHEDNDTNPQGCEKYRVPPKRSVWY